MNLASQSNMGKHCPSRLVVPWALLSGSRSVAEYNANNAWYYNGNNGCVNNNNKYNGNGARVVRDYLVVKVEDVENCMIPLSRWYSVYWLCRQRKANKPSHLAFYYGMPMNLIDLTISIKNMEYIPEQGICFIITYPRIREVIAADFIDRLVQTWFCKNLMPYLERFFLHKDSYACREGKGTLAAVRQVQEYIFDLSWGFTEDVWLAKLDIQSFFTSIDTELSAERLIGFIQEHVNNEDIKNLLIYLTRIIYQSLPQMHCVLKSPDWLYNMFPERKRMRGKVTKYGVAIGNQTSQMIACFMTTYVLRFIEGLGYAFVHYTDDTCIIITDKAKWLVDRVRIKEFLEQDSHLTQHPDKIYLQHYSKGVEFLGMKIRFDRVLPSDRIVHNFRWKVEMHIRKGTNSNKYLYREAEHFSQIINSYMGLFKWCNTYRLRKEILTQITESCWGKIYVVSEDYTKVNVIYGATRQGIFMRKNKARKKARTAMLNELYSKLEAA